MITAPKWLNEFPFIQSQWIEVERLSLIYPEIEHHDLIADWHRFIEANSHADHHSLLRRFRKSRLAFLAFHDFTLPIENHLKTMHKVSELADLLINQAYSIAAKEMKVKFGEVIDATGQVVQLQIFALGKLGTYELNYSSDVDLVFIYTAHGASNGKRSLDSDSYFTRLGQKLIKLLDHYSTDGLVYRVDMRLRPFGAAGPLVCSVDSLNQYLVNEGRDWERFAWMRARLVCGDRESARTLLNEVASFIYRKHLDYNVFSSLAEIKTNIASAFQSSAENLKHGIGGIRTIEFIVQSLQLVFGGRESILKNISIYPVFDVLNSEKKLSSGDVALLKETWLWLRKTENICQIVNDQAVHEVPSDHGIRSVIAKLTGFADWQSFKTYSKSKRSYVDDLFVTLFHESTNQAQSLPVEDKQTLQKLLGQINLERVPQDTVQKVKQLLEITVSKASFEVCNDFTEIIKVLLKRPSYLLMLLREQNVHNNVLDLLATHPYFKSVLRAYPVLFEQLFDHHVQPTLTTSNLIERWQVKQSVIDLNDVENWMEQLRYFKLVNQFNLMRHCSAKEMAPKEFSVQLTVLAEFIINEVCHYAWGEMAKKIPEYGVSVDDLMVVAYGSMAVSDMTVTSDLDLVFLIEDDSNNTDQRVFVHKWVKRIMHHLTSQMYHGMLYEIDLQLRPNGQSGPLVTSKVAFEEYQKAQAWTWEHVAMVKSRMVKGSDLQKQWHGKLRECILIQARNPEKVEQDLAVMAEKLTQVKRDKSHQHDFRVLAKVLIHAQDHPELVSILDMADLSAKLEQLKLI